MEKKENQAATIPPKLTHFPLVSESMPSFLQSLIVHFQKQLQQQNQGANKSSQQPPETPKAKASSRETPPRPRTPQPKTKKTHKSPTHQSAPKEGRTSIKRSITPVAESIKRVLTPTWEDTDTISSPEADSIVQSRQVPDFSIEAVHGKMEYHEARIQMGMDDEFKHPAMATRAAERNQEIVLNRDEAERFNRYKTEGIIQPKPLFWTDRVWDLPDNVMTEEQSKALTDRIENSYEHPKHEGPSTPKPKASPKNRPKKSASQSNRNRRFYQESIVSLTTVSFETDDEDDLTDYDLF